MSTAAVAARRALQQQRTRVLYRKALRNVLSWAVHRDIFYVEAQKMREQFEMNKDLSNLETIDRLLYEGESRVEKFQHPDPYIGNVLPYITVFSKLRIFSFQIPFVDSLAST
uniref:NADH dehydrogenase [ubiquinone] 1 beta subcomplex subunit 9 n=1 Tax=Physcomitrium patens TaxID=3218 RepID=A0A7I4E1N8_PHYPA